ncbi:hypothetical protein VFPPC_09232 [Pochonia chlamydosporia 170]|uniref:Uncharacterized protein n=1 Tax=Pochonia chlamydosporia 170 TaxID=1380566 RepID=A0A179FE89_METCM|nr:hypothetical protein VFPPC_09232 [Pochonia chlamydosporia 170]OAQ63379.1 hypothetical protein VFPPC_09232 [Pochonia chlamydosporia 170]
MYKKRMGHGRRDDPVGFPGPVSLVSIPAPGFQLVSLSTVGLKQGSFLSWPSARQQTTVSVHRSLMRVTGMIVYQAMQDMRPMCDSKGRPSLQLLVFYLLNVRFVSGISFSLSHFSSLPSFHLTPYCSM